MYDILMKLGGIERSVTYLEAQAQTADQKLDTISTKLATAEGSIGTLKWIGRAIGIGLWGLLAALILMWAKHHFGL
jgi:tetrahydromethanopterin S-methyltransferase subunit G